jgi:hypothetical protein
LAARDDLTAADAPTDASAEANSEMMLELTAGSQN